MIYSLTSFGPEFWKIDDAPCVPVHGSIPVTVEQALWDLCVDSWKAITAQFFPDRRPDEVSVKEVMEIIKETNTCSNLDSPVEVWIDKKGDFKIKVYYVR